MDQTLDIIKSGWDKVRNFRIMLEVEVVIMEEELFIKGKEEPCIHLVEEFKFKVEMDLGMVLQVQYMVPVILI